MRITYPVSPNCREEYFDMDVKFKDSDAYTYHADNVLAVGRTKHIGMENETNIDLGYEEFKDSMVRKNQSVFSQQKEDTFNENKRKGVKKRGRKNKFHTKIEDEDKRELEAVEASDQEQLAVIKE